jgi:hypothetical protein
MIRMKSSLKNRPVVLARYPLALRVPYGLEERGNAGCFRPIARPVCEINWLWIAQESETFKSSTPRDAHRDERDCCQ